MSKSELTASLQEFARDVEAEHPSVAVALFMVADGVVRGREELMAEAALKIAKDVLEVRV